MPSEHDRHSRPNGCCEGIYSQPSRSQQRGAVIAEQQHPEVVPQGKRPPGKKDPDLCKAAHWKGPHQPALRMKEYGWRSKSACEWTIWWRNPGVISWCCGHEEYCAGCGKILRTRIEDGECPGYHPITAAEVAAIEAKRTEDEARLAAAAASRAPHQRRPVIDGPQGYRRKRAG